MIFGEVPTDGAEGAILAHSLRAGGRVLKKGRVLGAEDVAALRAAGIARVVCARLEPGDVGEDEAADRIARACLGPGLSRSRAATGRVNLHAAVRGLFQVDRARVDALNAIDEAVTLATLPQDTAVEAGEMVATVKIIPFAVASAVLAEAEAAARGDGPLLALHPFRSRPVGLVLTRLPGLKESVLEGTVAATRARLDALGATLLDPEYCPHEPDAVARALVRLAQRGARILLVTGASAVVDRRDVCPAAIVHAGGELLHFGMPVDPGNLLLLGRIGDIPAVVLPGCARSPKRNGVDWVLERLMADVPIGGRDIMALGVGGLLKETPLRPLPRARATEAAPETRATPRIAAIVLAAGRSSRFGGGNKLLVRGPDGRAMIARTVDNVLASHARPVIVVTGHAAEEVAEVLSARDVVLVHNPDHASGLASSIRAGIDALGDGTDGALIVLGDMPLVRPMVLDRLIDGFDPEPGRDIVVPTYQGVRGNPVLFGARFFPALRALAGDVGARALLAEHAAAVHEVAVADDGVLRDFDTPEALAAAPDLAGA